MSYAQECFVKKICDAWSKQGRSIPEIEGTVDLESFGDLVVGLLAAKLKEDRVAEMFASAERGAEALRNQGWGQAQFAGALADMIKEENPLDPLKS